MIHLGCSSQERPRLRGMFRRGPGVWLSGSSGGWLAALSRSPGGSGSLETLPSTLRQDEQGGEIGAQASSEKASVRKDSLSDNTDARTAGVNLERIDALPSRWDLGEM